MAQLIYLLLRVAGPDFASGFFSDAFFEEGVADLAAALPLKI